MRIARAGLCRDGRQIICRKGDKHRIAPGKVDAGPGGVALTDKQRLVGIAGDEEGAALNLAACQKAFCSIRENALYALNCAL